MSNKGFILVVSGPSGSGKSSISKEFLKDEPNFDLSISHTTRPMRSNEVDGRDYYFISKQSFTEMIERNEFVEWAEVFGNYYGTSKKEVERIVSSGKNILLEIDVKGAMNVKSTFKEDVVTVFILPETFEILKERLFLRNTDSEDVILRRISDAKNEIEKITFYEYVIINKNGCLKESVQQLKNICSTEFLRTARFWNNYKLTFWSQL